MKLGDIISNVATPVARFFQLDCIDPQTNTLRPDSPCNQRRLALNDFSDAIYDRFWKKQTKKGNNMADEEKQLMDYQLTVAIKAMEPYDEKVLKLVQAIKDNGGSLLHGAVPRPQQIPQPQPVHPVSLFPPGTRVP